MAPRTATGLFATLRAFRVPGSGATARCTAALLCTAAFLFGASAATAAPGHKFLHAFNAAGEAPKALQFPEALAVDDSGTATDGDLYVSDPTHGVVDRFDSTGKYLGQLTGAKTPSGSFSTSGLFTSGLEALAIDQSDGDLYFSDFQHEVVDKFKPSASEEVVENAFGEGGQISAAQIPAGQIGSSLDPQKGRFRPQGLAVDPKTGDLFVVDSGYEEKAGFSIPNSVIDVFDSSGKYLRQFAHREGFFSSLAIDSAGNLYVTEAGEVDVYVAATGKLNPAYGQGTGVLDTEGSSVAVDPADDDVYVSHGEEIDQYDHTGALLSSFGVGRLSAPSSIGVGSAAATIYVANRGAGNVAVFGRPIVPFPTPVTGEASDLLSTTATLNGTVNPEGLALEECEFEYVKAALYNPAAPNPYSAGSSVPCEAAGGAPIGSGSAPVAVHADLTGLTAATVYHFRLVAANSNGPYRGADQIFGEPPHIDSTSVAGVTTGAAELQAQINPEGVAASYRFEYLTEEQFKANGESFNGASVIPIPDAAVPAPIGTATGAIQAGQTVIHQIRSSVGVFPLGDVVTGPGIPPGTTIVQYTGADLFLSAPATATASFATITVSAVVSQPLAGLLPDTPYVYRVIATNSAALDGVTGPVRLFATHPPGLDANLPDGRTYELVSPSVKDAGGGVFSGTLLATEDGAAVSYDGEPFFQSPAGNAFDQYTSLRGPEGWTTRNTTGEEAEEAFAPHAPPALPPAPVLPPSATHAAQVVEETPDGTIVFFTDPGQLTGDSTAAPGEPDLYRYEVESEQITDLSVADAGEHADVQGVLGVGGEGAEAGSWVYFVADGVLGVGGASRGDCAPDPQSPRKGSIGTSCNLYLAHDGATTFIAVLSARDSEFDPRITDDQTTLAHDWAPELADRTAEASPNGRYLALVATEPLTTQPVAAFAGPQVFRYDAVAKSLLCASCNPDGSNSSPAFFPHPGTSGLHPHYMAGDGRLFFNDTGALSPRDVNGRIDVYEFEDAGIGSCQTPGGCRSLISGGGGTGDSVLAAAGPEGDDAFFFTTQRLSSEDRDGSNDVYDARVDGRIPPAPAPICETADGCHGAAPPPPAGQTAGSTTFSGPEEGPNHLKKTPPKKEHHKKHHHKNQHGKRAGHKQGGGSK